MVKNTKQETARAILTITVGLLVVYVMSGMQWALVTAVVVGCVGVLSPYLSRKIEWVWMQLAGVLGKIMPNALLTAVFYLVLLPIALLSRMGGKDPLRLKNRDKSTFKECNKEFDKVSFEQPW
ncbi:hypothetical protein GCM10023093_21580 [Nemorincola caseinilytica]|uniref:SxtJ n=1 Tax=Nemorincola caseinilytica TaxID=2054315 RepID=A0ABP8NJQ5_9BACT